MPFILYFFAPNSRNNTAVVVAQQATTSAEPGAAAPLDPALTVLSSRLVPAGAARVDHFPFVCIHTHGENWGPNKPPSTPHPQAPPLNPTLHKEVVCKRKEKKNTITQAAPYHTPQGTRYKLAAHSPARVVGKNRLATRAPMFARYFEEIQGDLES